MRDGPVLIIGQGLAGSLLGWTCERAGVAFHVVDAGHATAASSVGAGILNPVTGRRFAVTWRFADWRERAMSRYRELERELGCSLVTELRLHRRPRDPAGLARWRERLREPEIQAWVEREGDGGFWLRGAAQVETGRLIASLRERWLKQGRLTEGDWPKGVAETAGPGQLRSTLVRFGIPFEPTAIVWCVGASVPNDWSVPWERAKGEVLRGELEGLDPGTLLNDGHWVLPSPSAGGVRVGATFDREVLDGLPSASAREELRRAALRLTGRELRVLEQRAALRVTVPDRRPVVGQHPQFPGCHLVGGLAGKGALWAPAVVQEWFEAWRANRPVAPELNVSRFW